MRCGRFIGDSSRFPSYRYKTPYPIAKKASTGLTDGHTDTLGAGADYTVKDCSSLA